MFGIDHAGLIAGGQDIVRGQGEIGHVLFAAGAGISDLRTIRNNLEKQAEDLFKPGGSKPAVNQSTCELNKLRKLVRETSLPSSEWQAATRRLLEEATKQLAGAEKESSASFSRRKPDCSDWPAGCPRSAAGKQANEQLAGMGDVPCLPPDFAENRRDAVLRPESRRNERGADRSRSARWPNRGLEP